MAQLLAATLRGGGPRQEAENEVFMQVWSATGVLAETTNSFRWLAMHVIAYIERASAVPCTQSVLRGEASFVHEALQLKFLWR